MSFLSLASIRLRLTKIQPLSPMNRLPFSPSEVVTSRVPSAYMYVIAKCGWQL